MVIQYLIWDAVGDHWPCTLPRSTLTAGLQGSASPQLKRLIGEKCRDLHLQNVNIIVADISTFEMEAS
ncbi:hypothetical protein AAZV13_20G060400 [Glycine max]